MNIARHVATFFFFWLRPSSLTLIPKSPLPFRTVPRILWGGGGQRSRSKRVSKLLFGLLIGYHRLKLAIRLEALRCNASPSLPRMNRSARVVEEGANRTKYVVARSISFYQY